MRCPNRLTLALSCALAFAITGPAFAQTTVPATPTITPAPNCNKPGAPPQGAPSELGKAAAEAQMRRGVSRRLVGFTLKDDGAPTPKECHLVVRDGIITGRVTSVARSPTLGRVIGLAIVAADQCGPGSAFTIKADGGALVGAGVTPTPFYAPDNKRPEL